MLCCVSRRAVAGADQGPPYDHCSLKVQPVGFEKVVQIEQSRESDVPPILLPCAICARTFMPQSLEKHSKICERSVHKKRKPFDSAKQRIQGTELAEFLPRQEKKRHSPDDKSSKPQSTWKETHDDFLRAIRAARNEITDSTMQKQYGATITSNAPTRANEQGTCPTCNRHFGVKAYDRHVAWCKERITRVPVSPANNIAKERLEARMKYRAPAVKSRRQATREKYSPSSAITLSSGNKTSPTLVVAKAKECASAPSCNKSNDSPVKQKSTVARRPGQPKESSTAVSMKQRPLDRINRPSEDEAGPPSFRPVPPVKRTSHLPVPPLKCKRESLEECIDTPSPRPCKKQLKKQGRIKRGEILSQKIKNDEKHQALNSARSLKANIVSVRSQGNPKINDVSINEEIVGITVKPCSIYKENQLTTWKQISECGRSYGKNEKGQENDKFSSTKEEIRDLSIHEKQNVEFTLDEDVLKQGTNKLSSRSGNTNCSATTSNLNQTYSFRDSVTDDKIDDMQLIKNRKWKPVRHSPRVEFCLGDPEKMTHISLINSKFPGETNSENERKNSCRSLKKESIKTRSTKYSIIKCESNETRSGEENFNFEASDRKLSPEGIESPKNRMFEKNRLKPTVRKNYSLQNNCEEDTSCSNFETMHSQRKLQENSAATDSGNTSVLVTKGRNLVDCENSQTVHVNENIKLEETTEKKLICLAEENSQSAISSEKLAYLDEFDRFCERIDLETNTEKPIDNDVQEVNKEIDQLLSRSYQSTSEVNKENKESNVDMKNSIQSLQNELECPTRSDNMDDDMAFHNMETTETNWIIENESDPFLTEGILQPTRSSTPFLNLDECSKKLCPRSETSEWKVEIDTERGSELLYRAESKDSNRLSSRQSTRRKTDELYNTVCENDTLQYQNCFSGRHSEFNSSIESDARTSLPLIEKKGKNSSRKTVYSTVASPSMRKQKPIKLPKVNRKEIASQVDICNCSVEVSSNLKCEKGVDEAYINFAENSSYSKAQICTVFANKNETIEESLETSSVNQFNTNSEKDDNYTSKNNDTLGNLSKTFEELTSAKEDISNEEVQEIYKNQRSNDFDCDSDNSMEHPIQDAISGRKASSSKSDRINQNLRSIVLSESCVKLSQRVRVSDSSAILKSRQSKILEMENKIRENRSTLNESSDSFTSSIDAMNVRQIESVEVETIEEIGTRNRSIKFKMLPEIKGATVVINKNYDENEKMNTQTYWEKASKASRNRLINLDPPSQGVSRFLKRNPKVRILPPVPSSSSLINHSGKDYDPFLLAEQQMNDLLSDTSEQSVTDSPPMEQNRDSSFPLSHSSAFVKYPCQPLSSPGKRSSLIAPPSEFDDLTSDFSSDSTETNSLSREVFLKDLKDSKAFKDSISKSDLEKKSPVKELGRRVIIDKSKALGGETIEDTGHGNGSFVGSSEKARKIFDKVSSKVVRPSVNRSLSVRASSAPKTTPDRKISNSSHEKRSSHKSNDVQRSSNNSLNNRNNNYMNLSSSNLSLSSIMSSDVDIKRSNSVFDELMTSFEDENGPFPSLKSLLKNDSLSISSPVHGRQRNGQISDDELSSPESYKRQDHNKISADSAYSSLNRKYSHHGRSTNDVAGRFDDEMSRNNRRDGDGVSTMPKCKMSKYCHECGSKFPETAKFCCECGIRRLVL